MIDLKKDRDDRNKQSSPQLRFHKKTVYKTIALKRAAFHLATTVQDG